MFPFFYNGNLVFHKEKENLTESDIAIVMDSLKSLFCDCKMESYRLSFSGFNAILKRHRWLSNGKIIIEKKLDNSINIGLELDFTSMGIVLLFLIAATFFLDYKDIFFALFGVTFFVLFFLFLYTWTILMYRLTIKSTINRIYDKTGKNLNTLNALRYLKSI